MLCEKWKVLPHFAKKRIKEKNKMCEYLKPLIHVSSIDEEILKSIKNPLENCPSDITLGPRSSADKIKHYFFLFRNHIKQLKNIKELADTININL